MNGTFQSGPDPWALRAATWPVAFAQVREDPRHDVGLAETLPAKATVVMIASGGETLVQLARLPLGRIHAVDLNPAQLAMSRLKCWLAEQEDPGRALRILGHDPMPAMERRFELERCFGVLGLDPGILGPLDEVAERGPDQCGRYEWCFGELQSRLATDVAGLRDHPGLDRVLDQVMSLENLVTLFGEGATQNPRQSFARHFAWRTRVALERADAATNPFLNQMYTGRFVDGSRYDWLQAEGRLRAEPVWHRGSMQSVLDSMATAEIDLVHLSNILDWLTPGEAQATLVAATRVLRPGGRLILRQLNSTLEVEALECGLKWDRRMGERFVAGDRSFFYPRIHIGTRS